jgi:LmbE family N-acetylglucosaminyl deacetylase
MSKMELWMRFAALLVIPFLVLGFAIESRATTESDENPVILAIFAHADDEIGVAALLAKCAREGAEVYLAIVTDGRFGVTDHAGIPAGENLAVVREGEARCAAQKLGIHPPYFLGFQDGFSHKTGSQDEYLELLDSLQGKILVLFDKLRPEMVITWGPEGGYGHSDHRMVSSVVSALFQEGESRWPRKLLYPGF